MNIFEYAIARTYFQLIAKSETRVLNEKEVRLLQALGPSVDAYEARETPQLKTKKATE